MRMTSLRPKLRARHAREFRASLELRGVRDMVDDQRDVQAPLPRLDGPQIGRRGFLRVLALGALGFAPLPIPPSLIPLPGGGTQFIPTPCQQCQNPPCVNVCPVAATFSTPEGTVLIEQDRCIGCRICMAACPYERRFFNWGKAPVPPQAQLARYSAEHQVPAKRGP